MKNLNDELEANYVPFNSELKDMFNNAFDTLESNNNFYIESYKRLSSFEAWKAYVLENKISSQSLSFYLEAQNDALLSYAFARIGSWRSALQCLRSVIENTLFFLYYKDHSVEYELWELGKHKLPISEYVKYISNHPKMCSLDDNLSGLALLKSEHSTLSKAVHASSINFRMTNNSPFPALMQPDVIKLNQWQSREKKVVLIINLILIAMYFDDLEGAKLRSLRKSISFAIPIRLHEQIRNQYNIQLFELPVED